MANHPQGLSQWFSEVSTNLPHLSKTQAMGLALYSLGMMVVQCCGITSIACVVSNLVGQSENTARQRLREVTYEAEAKCGDGRQAIEVRHCFAPLLRWIVRLWPAEERRMALALDASTLGQRFTVLALSVMYRGCAIPVAWVVLPATKKGAWMPHWKRLLRDVRGALPDDWLVIVLSDQGLYSKTLYRAIQRNGWHPMLRITGQGLFRPTGEQRFRPLSTWLPYPKTVYYGRVDCFVTPNARLSCTLLAHWDAGFDKPWLLLTDLAPETANALWYALRMWIEHGFKDCKRGGFRWEQTKMTNPERATRLWLVIALATLRVISVGGALDHQLQSASGLTGDLPPGQSTRPRRLSVFKRGLLTILAHLMRFATLPPGRFWPEPWPSLPFPRDVWLPFWRGGHFVLY
jgi:hypothetical protein